MLDRDEIQKLLPKGLILDLQRAIPDCHGLMFDCFDRRLGSDQSIRRNVRILEMPSDAPWRAEWLSFIKKLAELQRQGVCRPLEVATADARHVYLVFDWFPAVLADQIPATGLGNSRVAWSVVEQLINGLAELHRSGISHGDFRVENVYLDTPTLTEETHVWIGHVELAKLAQWTNGERMDSRMRDIFPPEWNRQLGEPSPAADVYALGLAAVELFAGHTARLNLASSSRTGAPVALSPLQNRMSWLRRNFLIKLLLAEAERRPKDGGAVQSRQRWIKCGERATPILGISGFAAGFIALLWLHGAWIQKELVATHDKRLDVEKKLSVETEQTTVLKKERGSLEAQLAEALTKLELLKKERDSLEAQLAKALTRLKLLEQDPDPEPFELQAQELWSQKFAHRASKEFDVTLKALVPQPPPPVRKQIVDWQSAITQAWDACNHRFTKEETRPGAKSTRREEAYYLLKKAPWKEPLKTELVKAIWQDFTATVNTTDEKLESVKNLCEKIQLNWVRQKLQEYLGVLIGRNVFWIRWASQPEKLTAVWKERVNAPWDGTAKSRELKKGQGIGSSGNEMERSDKSGEPDLERVPKSDGLRGS